VSIPELKALARKHWEEWLPEKVKALRAEGKLDEASALGYCLEPPVRSAILRR
jgi:hypothetical protein